MRVGGGGVHCCYGGIMGLDNTSRAHTTQGHHGIIVMFHCSIHSQRIPFPMSSFMQVISNCI